MIQCKQKSKGFFTKKVEVLIFSVKIIILVTIIRNKHIMNYSLGYYGGENT